MSSRTFGEVRFCVYPNDHPPRHVHAYLGKTLVVINLLLTGDVDLADRESAIKPKNAKKSDVRKALNAAADHFDELVALWEGVHGKA